jgi:hypothetical protein
MTGMGRILLHFVTEKVLNTEGTECCTEDKEGILLRRMGLNT